MRTDVAEAGEAGTDQPACPFCGSTLSVERRLVRAAGGGWTIAVLPPRCRNPRCGRGQARSAAG